MKTILILSFMLLFSLSSHKSNAQVNFEDYVQAEVLSYYPPIGPYNYFGYKLTNITSSTILVEGYLSEIDGSSAPYEFSVMLDPYQQVESDWVYILGATSSAEIVITSVVGK